LFIDLQQIAYLAASLDMIHNFIIGCLSEHDANSKTTRSYCTYEANNEIMSPQTERPTSY